MPVYYAHVNLTWQYGTSPILQHYHVRSGEIAWQAAAMKRSKHRAMLSLAGVTHGEKLGGQDLYKYTS